MKKKLVLLGLAVITTLTLTSCTAEMEREMKDAKSDWNGGLNRVVNVYGRNGDLIASYNGKIDIDSKSDTKVKFELDGKRYIYYNCQVEVIEK